MAQDDFLITGLGAVSAAGRGLAQTLESLGRGERNAAPATLFPTATPCPVFEVPGLDPSYDLEGRRTIGLALMAVEQAMTEAGLDDCAGLRVGVCMGTTVASQLNNLPFYASYRGGEEVDLKPVDNFLKGNLSEFIARKFSARGPAMTVVNACSSGTDAIGVALTWLKSDLCDLVIAGGADELSRIPYCGFSSLGLVNPDLCAPFDRDRKGLNLGEGAGVLIIEKKSLARRRGVRSRLFLAGYGSCGDAYHLTAPSPDGIGLRSALGQALNEAGITADRVSFVNAHGTGTLDNDRVEGAVLADVFGAGLKMLSTKGYTGHTLGAAGGLEAVFAAAALREGWIPASAGFVNRDETIPIAPVRERTAVGGAYAVSTSLAFGGNNAVLVIGQGSGQ